MAKHAVSLGSHKVFHHQKLGRVKAQCLQETHIGQRDVVVVFHIVHMAAVQSPPSQGEPRDPVEDASQVVHPQCKAHRVQVVQRAAQMLPVLQLCRDWQQRRRGRL